VHDTKDVVSGAGGVTLKVCGVIAYMVKTGKVYSLKWMLRCRANKKCFEEMRAETYLVELFVGYY
jgi:hypothetical protein